MSKNEQNTGPHHTLMFDFIETNVGNGYNNNTGVFTATEPGVYLFSYTIFPNTYLHASFEIVVNSVSRGAIFVGPPTHQTYISSTGVAVFSLKTGDVCYIRTHSSYASSGTIRSDDLMRSSFSGVKISQ